MLLLLNGFFALDAEVGVVCGILEIVAFGNCMGGNLMIWLLHNQLLRGCSTQEEDMLEGTDR